MSRQINFFAEKQGLFDLLHIISQNAARIAPEITEQGAPIGVKSVAELDMPISGLLYLVPAGINVSDLLYKAMDAYPGKLKISQTRSPVVEFGINYIGNTAVGPHRFYLPDHPTDPKYKLARDLYMSLERYVSRWRKTSEHNYFVSDGLAQRVRDGQEELRIFRKSYNIL